MANPEHLAILKQGFEIWNEWRKNNPKKIRIDLRRAYLYKADLRRVNLNSANLSNAHLSSADLGWARFVGLKLVWADLSLTDLVSTVFSGADLKYINLTGSILRGTILVGADLNNAFLDTTTFADIDLSEVTGLEHVRHLGPSYISIDTLYKSKGNIPEVFLRGCGVPEDMIAYACSLRGRAIDFYSCFISHSAKDKRFCERLYADLQAKGVRVWYFPEDAKWGEPVWGEIDRSIKVYDKLVVVCSENSLQSGPVNREIERALNREDKESKGILFPIRIDDYFLDTWEHERKADVLRKVVGDFSGWDKDAAKHDKAFERLLKGLQAESARV